MHTLRELLDLLKQDKSESKNEESDEDEDFQRAIALSLESVQDVQVSRL